MFNFIHNIPTMDSQNLVRLSQNNQIKGNEKEKRNNWFLYFCSFTANLLAASSGFALTWPSSVIPKLKSTNPDVNPFSKPVTTIQISTLAALPTAGGVLGLIITPIMSDNIGRKKSLFVSAVVLVFSFIILGFVKDINIYYVCVFLNGVFESVAVATVPMYGSEIAQDKNRSQIGCLIGLFMPLGTLLGYASGFASIKVITSLGAIFPLLFIIFSFFIPESPIFLASKGRDAFCLKSLEKLRCTRNVDAEYEEIKQMIQTTNKIRVGNVLDIFRSRGSFKAFLLCLEIMAIQLGTGIFLLGTFMAPIFNEAGSYLSGNSIGVLAELMKIFVIIATSFFINTLGKRTLLLVSCFFCMFPLLFLGIYFYLKYIESAFLENLKWLPILCVVIYYIGYSVGFACIPIVLISELLPNELRAVGIASLLIIFDMFLFLILFTFPFINEAIGVHFSLWICCICMVVGFFMMYYTIPETTGKSFTEIQKMLENRCCKIREQSI